MRRYITRVKKLESMVPEEQPTVLVRFQDSDGSIMRNIPLCATDEQVNAAGENDVLVTVQFVAGDGDVYPRYDT